MLSSVTYISLILLISPNFSFSQTCDYDALCDNQTIGDSVGDPYDCYSYYHCIGEPLSISDKYTCSSTEYFNSTLNTCVEEIVPCDPLCDNFQCPKECKTGSVLNYIANPNNCSEFFECGPSDPVDQQCPPEAMYFNGRECVTNQTECCSGLCDPYCIEEDLFRQVEDPSDCRSYYYCLEVGVPSCGDGYGTCTAGEVFDAESHSCLPGATCQSYCSSNSSPCVVNL